MSTYELNDREKRIRKTWLILTFMNFIGISIIGLGVVSILFDGLDPTFYTTAAILLAIGGIIFLALYYFSYKKHGNDLLTFMLIITALRMPISMYDAWQAMDASLTDILIYTTLLDIGISLWWCILSLKLRKINKEIQSFFIRSTPEYLQVFSILKDTSTLEQLNTSFGSLLREKDNGNLSLETAIIEAYKTQKRFLSTNQAANI